MKWKKCLMTICNLQKPRLKKPLLKSISIIFLNRLKKFQSSWIWVTESRDSHDPVFGHTHVIDASADAFYSSLNHPPTPSYEAYSILNQCDQAIQKDLDARLGHYTSKWTDGQLTRLLASSLNEELALFCSNSLPVRLMDTMGSALTDSKIATFANRGASGIDGIIASAVGVSTGLKQPLVLLIGDLAMLHDLNSLALVAKSPFPITLIIIQNNGGGIFRSLPISSYSKLSTSFTLDHSLTFESAAHMFGLDYRNVKTHEGFAQILGSDTCFTTSMVIECNVEPISDLTLYKESDIQ